MKPGSKSWMSTGKVEPMRTKDLEREVPRLYRVLHSQRELTDTVTLRLSPLSGQCPKFHPGQFNMLYQFGVGEIPISMSGDPSEKGTYVHTIREVGAVSGALATAAIGSTVGLRGPFGRGWPLPAPEGWDIVMVAGGLGLAPLRPAIYDLLAHRERYGRILVLFGSRNSEGLLYRKELERWNESLGIEVELTVDHASSGWSGNVGVVPALIPRARLRPKKTIALVCGPEVMMRFAVKALESSGVDSNCIFVSMERNMKCAVGLCGHCQFGPTFVCKDGPVLRFDLIANQFSVREL